MLHPSKIVNYNDGCSKGYNNLSDIKQKLSNGKALTSIEAQRLVALEEILKDSKLGPKDRSKWLQVEIKGLSNKKTTKLLENTEVVDHCSTTIVSHDREGKMDVSVSKKRQRLNDDDDDDDDDTIGPSKKTLKGTTEQDSMLNSGIKKGKEIIEKVNNCNFSCSENQENKHDHETTRNDEKVQIYESTEKRSDINDKNIDVEPKISAVINSRDEGNLTSTVVNTENDIKHADRITTGSAKRELIIERVQPMEAKVSLFKSFTNTIIISKTLN